MGKQHTFYDYIDAAGGGSNIIKGWLNGGGKAANAIFITRIELLEASPPGDYEDSVWKPPFVIPLKNNWKGFIEIRAKANKKQYRLVGEKIDRNIFLATWGFHDGKGWNIDVTPATAKERVKRMIDNSEYRKEHEF